MIRPALLAMTLAPATTAGAFELAFPVQCTLGHDCFLQNYVDHDPGSGAHDFTCGPLSYDGHDGTDIRVATLGDMQAGVTVLAAAPGTVAGVRDGMADIPQDDPAAPAIDGKDCGNGVLIDHGDGWQTQYCHLRQGSVTVKSGDKVTTGATLGQIGLSGRTVFPHLHLSVRKDGAEVDPFAPDATSTCGAAHDSATDLWAVDMPYDGFGFLDAGITTAPPDFSAIRAGMPPAETLPADAPALVVWGFFFGARAGDVLTLRLDGPEGIIAENTVTLERAQAQAMQFTGRKARGPWPTGDYTGTLSLTRDRAEIERWDTRLRVD